MRYFTHAILAILFLNTACNHREISPSPNINQSTFEKPSVADCGKEQQERPYTFADLDHGLIQSPINILSKEVGTAGKHSVELHFNDEINAIEKLGHSVQLDFKEGSSIIVDGKEFEFKQLHFHTPSEHLVDGITYPMEMHIVHVSTAENKDKIPEYLVVGLLFKMGEENRFINEFLSLIPSSEQTKKIIEPGLVKLSDLFSDTPEEDLSGHYHYRGSLTTPPYSESVSWYIDKTVFEASPEQIQAINTLEGNNARHIQGVYGRQVDQ